MSDPILVIGGGIGGMFAALRGRRLGADVCLIEARDQLGGLASGLVIDGTTMDAGPYILLDRHRLAWAFDQVGVSFAAIELKELDPAYQVHTTNGRVASVFTDLERTCESLSAFEPGAGDG